MLAPFLAKCAIQISTYANDPLGRDLRNRPYLAEVPRLKKIQSLP